MRTIIALLLVVGTAACIHKSSGAATPWEKVTAYNATFAQVNQTVEQGAEQLSSANVLSKDKAAAVIAYTYRVASAHQQVTSILGKGTAATAADFATLTVLLQQIQTAGQVLIASGDLGIKNPKTQQTVAQDLQAVIDVAQLIINLIPQLTSSPAPSPTGAEWFYERSTSWA